MIISASYRTDIPTFYGEWLIRRLRAGFCSTLNPYSRKPTRVGLRSQEVEGLVLWTKNIGPFRKHLDEVRELGHAFVVQHTVNNYPRALETSVVDSNRSIAFIHEIAEKFGPRVVVWRYDPIVFSDRTPYDFHVTNFARLASALRGAVDEVVVSFVQLYQKTKRNLDAAAAGGEFSWWDPKDAEKRELATQLVAIAADSRIQLSVCSQAAYAVPGSVPSRCVDAARIADVRGTPLRVSTKGNRPDCMCAESRDIGEYDTCPHGCVYCYAVRDPALAARRFRVHDPDSEFLFAPEVAAPGERGEQLSFLRDGE